MQSTVACVAVDRSGASLGMELAVAELEPEATAAGAREEGTRLMWVQPNRTQRVVEAQLHELRERERLGGGAIGSRRPDGESRQMVEAIEHQRARAREAAAVRGAYETPLHAHGAAEAVILPVREAGDGRCVGGDEDTRDAFGAQDGSDRVVGEMLTISDKHGHQAVLDKRRPQVVVVAREHVGAPVAEVGEQRGAALGRREQLGTAWGHVAEGDAQPEGACVCMHTHSRQRTRKR